MLLPNLKPPVIALASKVSRFCPSHQRMRLLRVSTTILANSTQNGGITYTTHSGLLIEPSSPPVSH